MNISGYGRPVRRLSFISRRSFAALALVPLLLLQAAQAAEVVRGPYLQVVTPESVIVRWRTDEPVDARVRYGTSTGSLSASAYSSSNGTEHEVQLTGLQPSTLYYYDVGSSAGVLAGDNSFNFVTAPQPGSQESVRFWVLGDMGTDNTGSRDVRDGYKQFADSAQTNLVMLLGDNAYEDGTDAEYQRALYDIYPELLRQIPLYSTFGNHDGHTAQSSDESGPYYDMFTFPRNGEAGGVASGTEAYYSFDYGNVHVVNLDSYGSDDATDGPMLTWLENDLAANDKDWVIAMWHHPAYSKGSHDSDTSGTQTAMRENVLPILERYGTDLVLSGHSHAYERSSLIDGHYGQSDTFNSSNIIDGGNGQEAGDGIYNKPSQNGPNEGTVYIVNGASGRVSDSGTLDHPAMIVNRRILGSTVIDVSGKRMDILFVGTSGETIDSFSITKGEDTTAPSIRSTEVISNTQIAIEYSETVAAVSAEKVGNYRLQTTDSGAVTEILNAELGSDGRVVMLTTAPLEKNVAYTLTVRNVTDQNSNVIAAGASAAIEWKAVWTMSFQNGVWPDSSYSGSRDTYLEQANSGANFGSASEVRVDGDDGGSEMAGLLGWDISAIPSAAVIESATITVDVTGATGGTYMLYGMNREWSEAGATWLNTGAGGAWGAPGALGTTDHAAGVLARFDNLSTGVHTITLNSKGIEVLQAWVDGGAANHGFFLYDDATTDGMRIASSEASATSRPRLTITYSGTNVGSGSGGTPPGTGTSPPDSGETTFPDVPPPSNIEAVILASNAVWVDWSAPLDTSDVRGYRVWVEDVFLTDVTLPEIEIYNLDSSSKYRLSVASIGRDGSLSERIHHRLRTLGDQIDGATKWKRSAAEKKALESTVPQSFVTLGKGPAALWISWSAPEQSDNVTGYQVWVDDTDMGVISESSYQALNLDPATSYQFAVAAVYSSGGRSAKARYIETTLLEGAEPSGGVIVPPTAPQDPLEPTAPGEVKNVPPLIAGQPSGLARAGSPYSFQALASDPDSGPQSLRFDIQNKPAWAAFSQSTGRLSGTPGDADVGTASGIIISVTDGEAQVALPAFSIIIREALQTAENSAGTVKFFVDAKSDFDEWTRSPSPEQQAWMRENYYRMQVYRGYFDDRLAWYPNALLYKDSYAMKPGWSVTSEHPEWVLRDADGNMLYIPFGCSNGVCTQYAADLGNYEFRSWWLNQLADEMSAGHIGIWVDDVNLKWRVSNGNKEFVNPIDPRTGVEMTYADYQRYFAEFMEDIRVRFPDAEIAHNTIWSTEPANGNDQYLERQVLAADYVNLERGVTDGNGLDNGTGKYGFESFLNYVDWVHSLGRNVILDDDDSTSVKDRDLELAVYFLLNNGGDLLGADGDRARMNPDNFWSGYQTNLGEALGERYEENGVFRRDFTCGVALAVQPEDPDRTVELGELMTDLDGNLVSSVTLGDGEGEVLTKDCAE